MRRSSFEHCTLLDWISTGPDPGDLGDDILFQFAPAVRQGIQPVLRR